MSKRVVIIASGETELLSLPYLVAHLKCEGIEVIEIRIPPRHRDVTVDIAEKLIKAAWYSVRDSKPTKFVVLIDTDRSHPEILLEPFRNELPKRVLPQISASIQFAYAQQHLEAWYFADSSGLRKYLGRDLGSVDASDPDKIQDPKRHLKNLLGRRRYTSVVSEDIAHNLDAVLIAQRSKSFAGFLAAVRNGDSENPNEEGTRPV